MLPLIVKFIIGLIMAITSFLIVKKLTKNNEKISLYTVIIILILTLPTVILYQTKYNAFILLITYVLSIILYRRYFKINIVTSIILCSCEILILTLSDLFISSINLTIFSYEEIRNVWYISIVNNLIIGLLSIGISSIKFLSNRINYLCKKIDNKTGYKIAIFATISILIIAILFYNITTIFKLDLYYSITIIALVGLFILYYFYISEKANYEKLNDEYNILFDYVQNFENWIDDEQMYRHELKNNLSIIRSMTNNKKIIEKIDEMIKFSIIIDDKDIEDLKNIPKGGLKGLLYYKVALAKNKKVKMVVEVSPKVETILKKLPNKKNRDICIILGIYLDNALEAAEESKEKTISLEIYEANKKINFTISNTYKNIIPLKTMRKKGFSTKGKSHGKGLYYADKMVNKVKWIEISQIFLNNYFIQKICVK
ncbi:MAG TPA: GHKL domain-containing protein [Candidatus Onthousia faecipullorum]|uniref:GHKL domain-containing protein n=1 Tax=Candidatus Onthousia faecipullorum TaxID=2840887 RepID=A0A9D1GAL2_9FIRM|nr:GHKL domain-containing protein [Candidatus Onthousia faecipullorum]